MDRSARNRKSVKYSDFQDDDDEDFTVKPPSKKPRTATKDPDSERNRKASSTSLSEVVDLTNSGNKKRVSLEDKLYERDLEAALTLSLLDRSATEEHITNTEAHDKSEALPPVLTHCNDGNSRLEERQPCPDSPPVLSNCSVDGNSLGLNLIINLKTSPPSVSKQRKVSEQRRNPLKEKNSGEDDDYQPQNTPDSKSDASFTEEVESEDETFMLTKKKNVKPVRQKTEKKTPQAAMQKKEKKEKTPAKASKVKNSALTTVNRSPAINRSPATSVSGLKTPTTPPLSKPALSSSPAGGRVAMWNPPGLIGKSPGASQNAPVRSPVQGLRLGLSRLARVKPLHSNTATH